MQGHSGLARSSTRDGLRTESGVYVLTQQFLRKESTLTEIAFARLLAWLDDGIESSGERYLEMRRRLVSYFERRNRLAADELADETFNRIAKTLEDAGVIATRPPARYCYVVAKFVLLEDVRRERRLVALDDSHGTDAAWRARADETQVSQEQRLDGLDRCLGELPTDQRQLIVEYYADADGRTIDRRRNLARRLGISMNALGIRAWRIRERLTACVNGCGAPPRKT